jgi:DNA-binding NtrC family response regulator
MAMILAVEDDLFLLDTLEWIIENLGHNSLLASDLVGARAHLDAACPIDMLFVDIRLKAMVDGGYQIADHAFALRPGIPVLYTSGNPLTDDMTGRFVPGGHFLQKPYAPTQLAESIGALVV